MTVPPGPLHPIPALAEPLKDVNVASPVLGGSSQPPSMLPLLWVQLHSHWTSVRITPPPPIIPVTSVQQQPASEEEDSNLSEL